MIETFVFSSESIFLREEDQMKVHQLLDYLKSRKQQIGIVFYDQAMMNQILLEHHLADYLDFSINGEKTGTVPRGLVDFLQVELAHKKVNFISNSLEQLREAKELDSNQFILRRIAIRKKHLANLLEILTNYT